MSDKHRIDVSKDMTTRGPRGGAWFVQCICGREFNHSGETSGIAARRIVLAQYDRHVERYQ